MIADIAADPMGGWLQFVMQGGALVLLGVVIYQLPRWLDKIQEINATERARILEHARAENKESRDAFERRNNAIEMAILAQTRELTTRGEAQTQRLEDRLETIAGSLGQVCKNTNQPRPNAT